VSGVRDPAAARARILSAAVRRIAGDGIDGVRIARIAMDAGVSPALVHYHFATRDQLLAEALDHSYALVGEARVAGEDLEGATHAARLQAMIDACLPSTDALRDDWFLWLELWLRVARHPALRHLRVEGSDERFVIPGTVTCYYHKQLAQEALRPLRGDLQLANQVTVHVG